MSNLSLHNQNATPFNPVLSVVVAPTVQTMSSKEIADMTGKEHKHVLADIRNMFEQLKIQSADFSADYQDSLGRTYPCFNLDKDLSICLVSGYNVQLRMAIIKRWNELEAQVLEMVRPSYMIEDPIERAKKWIEEATAKQAIETKLLEAVQVIEIQAPKAEVFDAVLDKIRTYTIREFAQRTGVKEKDVKKWLADKLWMTGTDAKSYRPLARANVGNYMRMIRSSKPFTTQYGTTCYNESIVFTQEGFNEAVRKMVKSGMMKPLANS